MIGLNPEEGRRKAFGIILALANLANTTLMVALATMTNSNSSANALGSIVMLLSILFSGFLLNRSVELDLLVWLSRVANSYEFGFKFHYIP